MRPGLPGVRSGAGLKQRGSSSSELGKVSELDEASELGEDRICTPLTKLTMVMSMVKFARTAESIQPRQSRFHPGASVGASRGRWLCA